jgi:protein-S-isoprenylcysteine O-methyltransferase Ste14
MSLTVALLRATSLLALASPMFIGKRPPSTEVRLMPQKTIRARLAVFANFGAFGMFFPALFVFAGSTCVPWALTLGVLGGAIAVTGSVIVWKSRLALGAAWSLLPKVGEQIGVVTSGPYRLIRHPIYLGLSVLAVGQAVAFRSEPAFLIVFACVIPSFVWRAREEERFLTSIFGELYVLYRKKTKMIIPHVL